MTASRRVLVVCSLPDRAQGGVERFVRDLSTALRGLGWSCLLVTNGARLATLEPQHCVVPMAPIETWHRVPTFRCVQGVTQSLADVHGLLRRFRPDVVHLHHVDYALMYYVLLRPLFRFRLVVTGHGPEVLALAGTRGSCSQRRLFATLIRSCEVRTCIAPEIVAAMEHLGEAPTFYIPNGIDLSYWQPTIPRPRVAGRVVCVARLSSEKGLDVLMHALSFVRNEMPNVSCLIIGGGAERRALEELVDEQGLREVVRLVGLQSKERIRAYLAEASLFVLPSRVEGAPLAILEAMAMGLPVVATRVGGVPSLLDDGVEGFLVAPEDPAALAQALLKVLRLDRCAEVMGDRARRRATRSSMQAVARMYERIYLGAGSHL